jgi:hypothetical protein
MFTRPPAPVSLNRQHQAYTQTSLPSQCLAPEAGPPEPATGPEKDIFLKVDMAVAGDDAPSTGLDPVSTTARFRLKRIPIILRIESWILYQSAHQSICDHCIAEEMGTSDIKRVTLATKKLALRESRFFTRWRGECSACGRSGLVIIARRLTWA